MKYLYLLALFFLFVGCSTTTPAVSEFRINLKPQKVECTSNSCKNDSLKVEQAFSSTSLMSSKMNYALGSYKQFSFTQSQWAESPNRAITNEIVKYVKASNIFKNVQSSQSRTRNRYTLEVHIEDFMQYFSEDKKNSFVNVSIAFTLIDTKIAKVLSSKTFISQVQAKSIDANGGVIALNEALNDVLFRTTEWLDESCK